MATTIINAFSELRSRLEITGLQAATVSTRQQNVRTAVEDGLKVLDLNVSVSARGRPSTFSSG